MRIPLLTPLWGIDPGPWMCGPLVASVAVAFTHSHFLWCIWWTYGVWIYTKVYVGPLLGCVGGPNLWLPVAPLPSDLLTVMFNQRRNTYAVHFKPIRGTDVLTKETFILNQITTIDSAQNVQWYINITIKRDHPDSTRCWDRLFQSLNSWIRMKSTPIQETPYWRFHGSKLSQS